MNYKVLYRKYRPSNFDEVVGQNNTIDLLKDSVENNKISHAYIFSGPRGTGKTSTAKIFAKTINCSSEDGAKPCGKCENCTNFAQSNDIYEIDAASNNGVDQIREIIDNIKLSPINSKYKVYIIDEVHMLSTSAFNALLLTLEEPPSHVVFILATTDIEDVPITVLSRCQRLDFKKISNKDIKMTLRSISDKENIDIDDAAIEEIAEFADGGLRDALSILDQLSKTGEKITQDSVLTSIGLISTKGILQLIEGIDKNSVDIVLDFVDKARENSADFKTVVKKIIQILKNKAIEIKKGTEKSRLSYADYKELCFELSSSLYKSNVNVDSYALLELILLNYVNNDIEIEAEIPEVVKFEVSKENISREMPTKENTVEKMREIIKEEPKKSAKSYFPGNNAVLVDVRINNCFVRANKSYLQDAKNNWGNFVDLLEDKKIKGMLLDTEIVLASDEIMLIKTDFQDNADNINDNLSQIEQMFCECIGANYKLISITQEKWNSEMEQYKENIKNKVEYKYKNEPSNEGKEEMLSDIFATQKIEVQ
ncbi:MAG: DNA polymerase III subunit gamma/tau [Bacilli bacterium]|nr:DNA polymerase III subunit gamma/tau [Bacilli bacterium]